MIRSKRQVVVIFAVIFSLLCCFSIFGHAATKAIYPEVMIILDGSGSMWGQIDGKTKIEMAKAVLHELIPSLPPEVKLGLTVYGHRQKGQCDDIEIMVPSGSDDRKGLLAKVDGISPKGKTPIADTVKMAVETLKKKENETTVILVSDGEETCTPDPCGVVKALNESGIKFILHVVGFDVDAMQKEELACLADAGGGTYFSANDGAGLLTAFESMKSEVVEKVEIEKAKTVQKVAKSGLGKLKVIFPETAQKSLAHIRIVRTKDDKTVKTAESPAPESIHPLISGEYGVVLGYANSNYKAPSEIAPIPVTINGGETTELSLGALVYNVAESLMDLPASSVTLRSEDGSVVVETPDTGNSYYFFTAKPLPAGVYSFEYHYKTLPEPVVVARDLTITPGKETLLTMDSGIQIVKNEQSMTGYDLISESSGKPVLQVRRRWDNDYPLWKAFAVPPDTYTLRVYIKGMDDALPVAEGVIIGKGTLLEFDTGL